MDCAFKKAKTFIHFAIVANLKLGIDLKEITQFLQTVSKIIFWCLSH